MKTSGLVAGLMVGSAALDASTVVAQDTFPETYSKHHTPPAELWGTYHYEKSTNEIAAAAFGCAISGRIDRPAFLITRFGDVNVTIDQGLGVTAKALDGTITVDGKRIDDPRGYVTLTLDQPGERVLIEAFRGNVNITFAEKVAGTNNSSELNFAPVARDSSNALSGGILSSTGFGPGTGVTNLPNVFDEPGKLVQSNGPIPDAGTPGPHHLITVGGAALLLGGGALAEVLMRRSKRKD